MNIIKALGYGWELSRLHLQSTYRVPLSVHLGLTNRCNNRCVYCHYDQRPQEDVWTTESLKKVLAEMKSAGVRRVQFTGGEPLLRQDLGEILAFARRQGFFIGVATNGFQVDERFEELRPVDVVQLSYDGPPEVHGALRGQKSVETVERALAALLRAGIRVWTTTVLTTLNAPHVEDIVTRARENGIVANFTLLDFFEDPQEHFHPALAEVKELVLTGDLKTQTLQTLIDLKKAGQPVGCSLGYLENARDWPYGDRVTSPEPSPLYGCWAGRATGHLEADAKLYACGMGVGRVPGIDVRELGFAQAWRDLKPLPHCLSCSQACGVEANLLFSLRMSSIRNWLGQLRKTK